MSWRKQKKRYLVELIQGKVKNVSKSLISNLFGVSRESLYLHSNKLKTKDESLKEQILQVLELNPSYGHRRIAIALSTPQHPVGKKRVRRVMKLYSIKPYKRKARWSKRRDLRKPDAGYSNMIKGTCPIGPNIVYVGDFTYLRWEQ